jgi:protein ImuB
VVDGVSRIACVRVEWFAAAALERCEPALREQPLAVVTGAPPATRVVEANARARAEGVRPGLSAAEAVVRCPALVRRPASSEAEAAARHALLDACLSVSPRLEDAAPGVVHVDLAGLRRLLGADAEIGRRLCQQARGVGLEARVGIAMSRAAAGVAARIGPRVHALSPATERAALAAVPLSALEWPAELAATFTRWGLTTLGQLAALPRHGVGARLGRAGLAAHDLAAGVDREPFRAWAPPPFWEEAQGLEWEIATLPALVPVLARVLERLCVRLTAAHMVIDALEVRLALASGGHHTRSIALAAPLGEPAAIVALLALELEAHPPPAAVTGVALSARVVSRRVAPGRLWHPPVPAPRDLAAVLARLTLLVGGANVGAPSVTDSHRPDDYTLAPFDGSRAGEDDNRGDDDSHRGRRADGVEGRVMVDHQAGATQSAAGPLALRRLRPPRRVEVETEAGRPIRVTGPPSLDAAVETCAGPWRLSGHWWDTSAWTRDEWDVELSDRTVWRLTHDRLTNHWFLDALYD